MEILKFHRLFFKATLLMLISIALSCSKDPLQPEPVKEVNLTVSTGNSGIIKDQYIVLLSNKPAKQDPRAQAALEALQKEVGNMPNARMKGIYRSALTGFVAKLNESHLEKLKKDPRVISVTADRYVELENTNGVVAIQDYPVYGLDRIDQRNEKMDRAYTYTSTGSGVTAYIIDTGFRTSHSEFNGRATLGYDFVMEYPDENDVLDPNQEPGEDCHGHGTHVAGTVGGSIYGVAKEVNLVNLRVFGCTDGSPWSRIIHAIDWVTANAKKPAVVNMSLGAPVEEIDTLADTAVKNSIASGVTYVIAGGNSSMDACGFSPARVPEAITVGASNVENNKASWSNYGDCQDLYAPGVYILSAGIADDNSTRYMSGTSMAAPHVAGIASLYLSQNPTATPAEVHQAVVENATPSIINNVPSGSNNLAYSHWEEVSFNPPTQPDLALNGSLSKVRGNYEVNLSWNLPQGSKVILYRDGIVLYEPAGNETSYKDVLGKIDNTTIVYSVCEVLYNNCSEATIVIGNGGESTEPGNVLPSADFSFSANLLDVQFTDQSTDSDGNIVAWNWNFGDGNSSTLQHPQHSYLQAGTFGVSLVVTDDFGDSKSVTKSVTVSKETSAPVGLELSAVGSKVKGQWQTDLSWTPAGNSAQIDIYRNGTFFRTVVNTGSYIDLTTFKGSGNLQYKICEAGTTTCSNEVNVLF